MPHPQAIDGFEFARCNSRLRGSRQVGEFPRLRGSLYATDGVLDYEIEGLPQVQGRPAIRLRVQGRLALQCQRCLGRLEFALRSEAVLLLYADEAELAALPVEAEGPERIVAAEELPVLELVEDEVLLAIPYAPRHETCRSHAGDVPVTSQRPFAALRALMGGKR
jgi:uncharacterized protein